MVHIFHVIIITPWIKSPKFQLQINSLNTIVCRVLFHLMQNFRNCKRFSHMCTNYTSKTAKCTLLLCHENNVNCFNKILTAVLKPLCGNTNFGLCMHYIKCSFSHFYSHKIEFYKYIVTNWSTNAKLCAIMQNNVFFY